MEAPPPASPGIWRWAGRFGEPPPPGARLSFGEGATPLLRSRRIGPEAGLENLYFKLESANPGGSYKDRFAAAAVSWMRARGQGECIATSSGNTGASLAAACAAAGLLCRIALVETAPAAKLRQMRAHGAELFRVRGFGTDAERTRKAFSVLREAGRRRGRALQVSAYALSPEGMRGVETLAFELDEQCGGRIDHVFLPAGGGGLCLAAARGFEAVSSSPAVHCVQPEGNDTMAGPLREGRERGRRVDPCTTAVSGLQVPDLLDADAVVAACRRSGGNGHLASDGSIFAAQRRLAREEGVFCEPAGATALAGLLRAAEAGEVAGGSVIVCGVTGSGFKDEVSLERLAGEGEVPFVEIEDLEDALEGGR